MYDFVETERPPKNRRRLGDPDLDWDGPLENALLKTLETKKAIRVPLYMFHSSPAKGRLWKDGYEVKHRVLRPDCMYVAAWLEVGLRRLANLPRSYVEGP